MTKPKQDVSKAKQLRSFPEFSVDDEGQINVKIHGDDELKALYGVKTREAGKGILLTAIDSLGNKGELYRDMMAAMPAEMEPQDAVEAMLVNQMVATNAALKHPAFNLRHIRQP